MQEKCPRPTSHQITFSTSVLDAIVQRTSVPVKLIRSLLSFPTIHQASMDNPVFPLNSIENRLSVSSISSIRPSHRLIDHVLLIDWLIDWSSIISMLQDLYINPSVGLDFIFSVRRDRVYQCKTKLNFSEDKNTRIFYFLNSIPNYRLTTTKIKKKAW